MVLDHIEDSRERIWPPKGFLEGRAALVTGGARRIGRHLALALADQGADIVLHYRESRDEATSTEAEITSRGGKCWLIQGDLADATVAESLLARAAGEIGRPLDILINNASIFGQGSALDTTVEDWDRNQAINLRAPYLLARALARQVKAGKPADVVNLNDYRALQPGPDHFAYTISKVGLHGLTRSLALALAPEVRVNELALGAILPPEGASEDYVHTLRQEIPTRKFGSPDEVSSAMLFVLANQGVTGQTLCIDGGRHLT